MVRHIEQETVSQIFELYGRECVLCGAEHVQLHHNMLIGGRQSDFYKTILPVCPSCHGVANRTDVREKLDYIMLQTFTGEELEEFSKVDNLKAKLAYLHEQYR
jgi:hypothetical protein